MQSLLLLLVIASSCHCLSTLAGTRWNIKCNIGLEPGSAIQKSVPNWGDSGARIVVNALVEFDESLASESEELVGPLASTRILAAKGGGKIVTFKGEEEVAFSSGGWCVQRAFGQGLSEEGYLRFWLDCPSGCAKSDVSVEPGQRIFFTTSTWDDAAALAELSARKSDVCERLAALDEKLAKEQQRDGEQGGGLLEKLRNAASIRSRVLDMESRAALQSEVDWFAKKLPSLAADGRAAQIEAGGMSVKRQLGSLGGFPFISGGKAVYHILGSFEAEPVLEAL